MNDTSNDTEWLEPRIIVRPPGPRSRELGEAQASMELPSFEARRERRKEVSGEEHAVIVYERGRGAIVECVDGNRYLDLVAGFGALPLGYGHPALSAALGARALTLPLALGDVYPSENKIRALRRLLDTFGRPGDRIMLGNSGSDAVGIALKSAELASGKPGVIAFTGAYHGLAHGPLAVCGLAASMRAPFTESISKHVHFASYPTKGDDLDASLSEVKKQLATGTIGAVIVEPLLGRGGGVGPASGFLRELRRLSTEHDALLIVDEVLTGCGRTGQWLASGDADPDIVCLGKAIAGGYPVSACIGRASVMEAWGRHGGSYIHTATHFGSPLAADAVLVTLDAFEKLELLARVRASGKHWAKCFADAGIQAHVSGLHVGVPLGSAARALATGRRLLERGYIVLTGGADGASLVLTPAYTITEDQLTAFTAALKNALADA